MLIIHEIKEKSIIENYTEIFISEIFINFIVVKNEILC